MKAELQALCDRYVSNRQAVHDTFKWDSDYIHPVCANLFCVQGKAADPEQLKACKKIIEGQTGIFSNFRGNIRPALASMLALSEHPEERMSQALDYYQMLKQEFWGSEYLALVSFLLTGLADRNQVEEKAARGKVIYKRMQKEHPFLTSSEDSVFAVLMAFSDKTDDALIADMEACYQALKARFSIGNEVQTVSHILALSDGVPEEKAGRVIDLYNALREAGVKYGRYYELSTLAALSVTGESIPGLVEDIQQVYEFLKGQKGYGGLFGLDSRTRAMHAALLVSDLYANQEQANTAAMTSTLVQIIAQEMAMCAITASVAASSAAASSH
ncbi:MAG: DUF4003 domain-containing protein [Clostridia bacterium]|nr:DUF4003 domain-containing protein [Clostridia bacterium]